LRNTDNTVVDTSSEMGGIMNNDIFMYKLTTDNGGAPCVENELLSLCICKPKIRMSAKVGD